MIEKISRAFKTSKREEITRTTTPPLPPNRVVKIFSEKRNGENGQWKRPFKRRDNWKFDMSLSEQRGR